MAGWLRRYWPFLTVAAASAILLAPACGALYRCGCRALWAGGESHCNVRVAGVEHCPWCEHRALGAVASGLIVGSQLAVFRIARRRLGPATAATLAFAALLPATLAAGALVWLPTDYPHFLVDGARARLGLPAGPIRTTGGPPHTH